MADTAAERLKLAYALSEAGAWDIDLLTGDVVEAPEIAAMYGLPPGQTNRHVRETRQRIHPDDRSAVDAAVKAAIATGDVYAIEHRVVWPDGSIHIVATRGKALYDHDGRAVRAIGVTRDVTARRMAAQALARSEERLRHATRAGRMFVWEVDHRTGRVEWGDGAGALLGTADTALPRHVDQAQFFMVEQDRARLASEFAAACAARLPATTGQFAGSDGRSWQTSYSISYDDAGQVTHVYGVTQDITDAMNAAAAVAASEARFRATAEALPSPLFIALPEGGNTFVNPAYCAYTGRDPCSLLHGGWLDLVHFEDQDSMRRGWQDAVESGAPFEVEYRLRRHDGVWRWQSVRALPVAADSAGPWVGLLFDVHDRHEAAAVQRARADAAVAERNRLWEVSDDLFLTARFDGQLYQVSESWSRLLGWRREELLTRPFEVFIHPDDLAMVKDQLQALRDQGGTVRYENRVRARTGDWRLIAWTLSSNPGDGRLYGVGRDVTHEREQAAMLASTQAQLHEARKLETIGQLTGGVAHDFNNLLTPIMLGLEAVRRAGIGDARLAEMVSVSSQAAERARLLVQRLLAFGRRQVLQPRRTDGAGLVTGMRDLIARSLGPTIALSFRLPHGLPRVIVDPAQFELALLNLAVNSRDAMPDGGRLTISARTETTTAPHALGLAPGRYVRFTVADTGRGMDAATLQRAIEPFFSTKEVGKGTGLGLSMVHGLAVQSSGALRLTSTPGRGTRADLWLPADDAAPVSNEDTNHGRNRDAAACR